MTTPSPSREELRRQRREQMTTRMADMQEASVRQAKTRRMAIIGIVVAVVLVIAGALAFAVKEATAPLPGEVLADEGQQHVDVGTPTTYATFPPASGPHYPSPAPWQFFDQTLPPGYWVHNLEHGGIALLYKCPADCTKLKADVQQLFQTLPPSKYGYVKLVAAPNDQFEGEVAVMAWTRRIIQPTFDAAEIRRFYQAFVDQGPEDAR